MQIYTFLFIVQIFLHRQTIFHPSPKENAFASPLTPFKGDEEGGQGVPSATPF